MKIHNVLSILLLLGVTTSFAHAEVCVVVDEANDTLADGERKGALALARTSFESAGETITEPPCDAQYKISNVKMGSAIIIKVSGPKGNRTGKAERIENLGASYDQLIRALIKLSLIHI